MLFSFLKKVSEIFSTLANFELFLICRFLTAFFIATLLQFLKFCFIKTGLRIRK
jgi:hypothetical protein